MIRKLRQSVCVFILFCCVIVLSAGCQTEQILDIAGEVNQVQSQVADIAQAIGQASYNDNETLNLLHALQAGNAASAPFNPYVLPIGAGLSGVIAVLEALRRKERGGRKYAEHELKNNNKGNHGAT